MTNPEPNPIYCMFCQKEMRYKSMPIIENVYSVWLEPGPCTCPEALKQIAIIAEQKRIAEEKAAAVERQAERERLLKRSGLPTRYQDVTFSTAKITDENRKAYATALKFLERPAGGLLLTGPVGTGKTHLSACVVNAYLDALKWVQFGGVIDLLGRIRKSYSSGGQEEEWQIIDDLTHVPLLVLDDLGKEKATEWVEQTLFRVIDNRYQTNRLLIVTTNYTMQDLQGRYQEHGGAIVSRLTEMCAGVFLGGEDWRMKRLK